MYQINVKMQVWDICWISCKTLFILKNKCSKQLTAKLSLSLRVWVTWCHLQWQSDIDPKVNPAGHQQPLSPLTHCALSAVKPEGSLISTFIKFHFDPQFESFLNCGRKSFFSILQNEKTKQTPTRPGWPILDGPCTHTLLIFISEPQHCWMG